MMKTSGREQQRERMFKPLPAPEFVSTDLQPVVVSFFGDESARALEWSVEQIVYRMRCRASGGVFRLIGDAETSQGIRNWSAVVKLLRYQPWSPTVEELRNQCDDGGDEPADFGYWLREATAYASGVLPASGSLRVPRCYGIRRIDNNRCWLWLEDIRGMPGREWDRHRFVKAAQHLGEYQGSFLAGRRALPNHQWFYQSFIESSGPAYRAELLSRLDDHVLWDDPIIYTTFDRSIVSLAKRVWHHQTALVQTVRRLPKAPCHWDFAPQNLLADDAISLTTVLLDWGSIGLGPAGADLSILAGTLSNEIGPKSFEQFESELVLAYLDGLRAAGWDGDEGEVHTAYRIFAALHFGILIGLLMSKACESTWRDRKARECVRPIERIIADQVIFMARALERVLPYLPD